ncbi:MAG: methyltransferase domain-containing protein [Nitrospinae bacterium]|nr:methyltransferase domain-containing protein [Nitrospinota bacterium]
MEVREYETMFLVEEGHWWYQGLHNLAETMIRSEAPIKMLDAGCGTGKLLDILADLKPVGFDFSPDAIKLSRKRNAPNLALASITDIPFKNASFDAAVSMDVLCNLNEADGLKALKDMRATLKPGGLLLINLPAFEFMRGDHDRAVHIKRRFTKKELETMLEAAGFKIDMITYRNIFLFPPAFLVRTFQRFFPAKNPKSDLGLPPAIVNGFFKNILFFENRLIRLGVTFPFGLSVFCAARKG